jgi:hypothetical protein
MDSASVEEKPRDQALGKNIGFFFFHREEVFCTNGQQGLGVDRGWRGRGGGGCPFFSSSKH